MTMLTDDPISHDASAASLAAENSARAIDFLAAKMREMRLNELDLYERLAAVQSRLRTAESVNVALVWTHPNWATLLERLKFFMDLAVVPTLSEDLLTRARTQKEQVVSYWQHVMLGAPSGTPRST